MKYQKSPQTEYALPPKLQKARTISALIPIALAIIYIVLLPLIDHLDVFWVILGTVFPLLLVFYFIHSLVFFLLCHRAASKQSRTDGVHYTLPLGITAPLLILGVLLAVLIVALVGLVILFTLAISHM